MEEGDLSVGLSEHEDEGVEELPVLLEVEDQVVLVHEEGWEETYEVDVLGDGIAEVEGVAVEGGLGLVDVPVETTVEAGAGENDTGDVVEDHEGLELVGLTTRNGRERGEDTSS